MDPEELFEDCCSEIELAYGRLGHKFGWRFLTCPRSALVTHPKIALITLQPAGRRDYFPELPRKSQERGSAYLVESWDGRPAGGDRLQRQVRLFFAELASRIGVSSGDRLLAESLSSHFVPFRSPSFAETPNKNGTLAFSTSLWRQILEVIHPKLIIVLQKESFEAFSLLLTESLAQSANVQAMPIGWGELVARIRDFSAGPTLCWFPHWSRFPVFGRVESRFQVGDILDVLSNKLR